MRLLRSIRNQLLCIRIIWCHNNYHIGGSCLLFTIIWWICDHNYRNYGWDLNHYHAEFARMKNKPVVFLAILGIFKVLMLIGMTVLSYTYTKPKEVPITQVKRRYCKYIMMRLLAVVEQLQTKCYLTKLTPQERCSEIMRCHMLMTEAIEHFRAAGRKLFERSDIELYQPVDQVLRVNEQEEKQLIEQGFDLTLSNLQEADIYCMVYEKPGRFEAEMRRLHRQM